MSVTTGTDSIVIKGQISKPGSYCPAPGENLLDLIFRHGGGMAHDRFLLKRVLLDGPAGHFATAGELKAPPDCREAMVFDEGSCLVNVLRMLLLYNDTCAKSYTGCPACRKAIREAAGLLAALGSPQATANDLARLKELAATTDPACPDHCSAMRPLQSALAQWENEFAEHVDGYCRAGTCTEIMLSPCANSCPAKVDLPGTIALMQMKKYTDALALGREANPLFLTCGYVCEDPPCQKNCKRLTFDESIYTQSLHRYAGDKAAQSAGSLSKALSHPTLKAGAASGKKVAIVGAGPAGLTAAHQLARLGHKVVVYDQMSAAGGMAAFGIPVYRLPREVLNAEAGAVASLGVTFEFGKKLGPDISLTGLKSENDAVLLAVGAWQNQLLSVPGEDLPGVFGAVDFLRHAVLSEPLPVGKRVLVVGGGNVAIDCARTAKRLGAAEVTMIYRRSLTEMPATRQELAAAGEEGIEVKELAVPTRIDKATDALKVTYSDMKPGSYDLFGRRSPKMPDTAGDSELIVDTVIVAVGQSVDFGGFAGEVDRSGPFVATDNAYATSLAGVFAAGDCAEPANSVVKAVAAGKAAATAIDLYLTGSSHSLSSPLRAQLGCFVGDYTCKVSARVEMPEQDAASRTENFSLVELGLDDSKAAYEMLRCICAAKGGKTG